MALRIQVTAIGAVQLRRAVLLAVFCCGCGLLPLPGFAAAEGTAQYTDGAPRRETNGAPNVPTMSLIDSPTAQCYGPLPETNVCYVQWANLQVSASPSQGIERMTVNIDGRMRAYYSGFFQSSMTVPPGMQPEGFKVVCGFAGAGGDPDYGYQYPYVIRARETGGLSTANFGTVQCPADHRMLFRNNFE